MLKILEKDYGISFEKNKYIGGNIVLIEKEVERIKKMYPSGTRIKLNYMEDDYGVTSGTYGIVDFVDDAGQIQMVWDNGRTTALIVGIDSFEVVDIPNEKNINI
ncbi:MAG: DUF4314 domain-containing protein [Bacilli bacterium]|nr:DUF4314 domain-containing protein [Bacilli bacterium]